MCCVEEQHCAHGQPHTAGLSQLLTLQKKPTHFNISKIHPNTTYPKLHRRARVRSFPSQQDHGCSHGGSPHPPPVQELLTLSRATPAPPSVTPAGSHNEAASLTWEFIADFWCRARTASKPYWRSVFRASYCIVTLIEPLIK